MSLSDEQFEFLQDIALLIQFASRRGYKITAGEMYRTEDQQRIYYEAGRSMTMDSQHRKRLAFDINLFIDGKPVWTMRPEWKELGDFWKSLNKKNRWGGSDFGSFLDLPHFERNS